METSKSKLASLVSYDDEKISITIPTTPVSLFIQLLAFSLFVYNTVLFIIAFEAQHYSSSTIDIDKWIILCYVGMAISSVMLSINIRQRWPLYRKHNYTSLRTIDKPLFMSLEYGAFICLNLVEYYLLLVNAIWIQNAQMETSADLTNYDYETIQLITSIPSKQVDSFLNMVTSLFIGTAITLLMLIRNWIQNKEKQV
jgi:hypothetical protein